MAKTEAITLQNIKETSTPRIRLQKLSEYISNPEPNKTQEIAEIYAAIRDMTSNITMKLHYDFNFLNNQDAKSQINTIEQYLKNNGFDFTDCEAGRYTRSVQNIIKVINTEKELQQRITERQKSTNPNLELKNVFNEYIKEHKQISSFKQLNEMQSNLQAAYYKIYPQDNTDADVWSQLFANIAGTQNIDLFKDITFTDLLSTNSAIVKSKKAMQINNTIKKQPQSRTMRTYASTSRQNNPATVYTERNMASLQVHKVLPPTGTSKSGGMFQYKKLPSFMLRRRQHNALSKDEIDALINKRKNCITELNNKTAMLPQNNSQSFPKAYFYEVLKHMINGKDWTKPFNITHKASENDIKEISAFLAQHDIPSLCAELALSYKGSNIKLCEAELQRCFNEKDYNIVATIIDKINNLFPQTQIQSNNL
jgi:hypothetical protein